jgi:hypothetical protein
MKMEMNKVGRVLVVLLFMISAGACAKKAVPTQPVLDRRREGRVGDMTPAGWGKEPRGIG